MNESVYRYTQKKDNYNLKIIFVELNSFNFCGEVLNKNNVGKLIEKERKY